MVKHDSLPVEVLELIIRHALCAPWTCISNVIESNSNIQRRLRILLVCKLWYRVAQYVDPRFRVKSSESPARLAMLPAGCRCVKLTVDTTSNHRHDSEATSQSQGWLWRTLPPRIDPLGPSFLSPPIPRPELMSHWQTLAETLLRREQAQQGEKASETIGLCLSGSIVVESHLTTLLAETQLASRITFLTLHFAEQTELDVAHLFHGRLVTPTIEIAYPYPAETAPRNPNPLPHLKHLHLHNVKIGHLPWSWTLCDEANTLESLSLDRFWVSNDVLYTFLGAVCRPQLCHLHLVDLWLQLGRSHNRYLPATFSAIQDRTLNRVARQCTSSLQSIELPGIHELNSDDLFTRLRTFFPRVALIHLVHDDQLRVVLSFSPRPQRTLTPQASSSAVHPLHPRLFSPAARFESSCVEEQNMEDDIVLTGLEIQGAMLEHSFPWRVITKFLNTPHTRYLNQLHGLEDE